LIPCNADGNADWGAVAVDAGATGGDCSDSCVGGGDDATRIFAEKMDCVSAASGNVLAVHIVMPNALLCGLLA
jgi:hypothetical protein